MKKIVLASNNSKKIKEIKDILNGLEYEVYSLNDMDINIDVEEDGITFEENSKKKATEIYSYLKKRGEDNFLVLADDSGLEVLALEGAPGVRSARYAGEEATDEENNKLLLQTMKFQVKRTCRFRCALAVAAPNGKILLESDGICDGMLLHEPLGTEGFGYDPLFWSTELHKGMGEATMQEKNKISHRGKAIKKLVANWGKMK